MLGCVDFDSCGLEPVLEFGGAGGALLDDGHGGS